MPASLLSLPNELLAQILVLLVRPKYQTLHECIAGDVLPASLVNRRLHDISIPIIYRDVYVNAYDSPSRSAPGKGSANLPEAVRLLTLPLANPHIARLVSRVDLVLHAHYSVPEACNLLFRNRHHHSAIINHPSASSVRPKCIHLRGCGVARSSAETSHVSTTGSCILPGVLEQIRVQCGDVLQELSLDLVLHPRNRETFASVGPLSGLEDFGNLRRLAVTGEALFGFERHHLGEHRLSGDITWPPRLEALEILYETLWTRRGWTLHTTEAVQVGGRELLRMLCDPECLPGLRTLTLGFDGFSFDDLEYDGEEHDAAEPARFVAEMDRACCARGVQAWVRIGYEEPMEGERSEVRTLRMRDLRWKSRRLLSTGLVLV